MTSGVLIEVDHVDPPEVDDEQPARRPVVPDVIRRRLARPAAPDSLFWIAAIFVTFIGGALRLINLAHPPEKIFDELYYAEEAHDLLGHGVEWNPDDNTPQYVVHPPLGKWMIGVG